MKTNLIAEIGINHNGDVGLAHRMVDAACTAGANIIKFQVHLADKEMVSDIERRVTVAPGIYKLIENASLTIAELKELQSHVVSRGTSFLATPFSLESIDILEDLGVDMYKIGSGETSDFLMLDKICSTGKKMLLSTGMSTIEEVYKSVMFLESHNSDFVLFQCTSEYPASHSSLNLAMLKEYKKLFGCHVGFSDHSPGTIAPVVAVSLGATYIEKHFTIDKNLPGPDQSSSIDTDELTMLAENINIAEASIGIAEKRPISPDVCRLFQHSLALRQQCDAGHAISHNDLVSKRPLDGIPSENFMDVIGKKLSKSVDVDALLQWSDLCLGK